MKIVLAALLGCVSGPPVLAAPPSPLLGDLRGLRNGVVAFFSGDELEPSAVVRVKQVRQEYETRGFFRIGLLPVAVLEGVVFENRHPDLLAENLVKCKQRFGSHNAKRVELRNAQIVTLGLVTNYLTCGCARPGADGQWELLGGIRFESGTNRMEAVSAVLHVTGPNAGQLVCATTPPQTNYLWRSARLSTGRAPEQTQNERKPHEN